MEDCDEGVRDRWGRVSGLGAGRAAGGARRRRRRAGTLGRVGATTRRARRRRAPAHAGSCAARSRTPPRCARAWPGRTPSSTSPATTASASRRATGPACTRATSRAPAPCSTRPPPQAWAASSTCPPPTCSATPDGRVVDETYRRPDRSFLSYYDETKFLAHELAEERAAAGQPVVIVCSGGHLRARRPLGAGTADRAGGGRRLQDAHVPRPRHLAGVRGRHGGRAGAGARPRPPRRDLHPGRRERDAGRGPRPYGARHRARRAAPDAAALGCCAPSYRSAAGSGRGSASAPTSRRRSAPRTA